jgi:hypothetical protein
MMRHSAKENDPMSDYDPNRPDPRRMDPARPTHETGYADDRGMNWSWIIGGVAVLAILVAALSFMGSDDRTASTQPPAATTGQSTPAPTTAPRANPDNPAAAPKSDLPRPATPNQ